MDVIARPSPALPPWSRLSTFCALLLIVVFLGQSVVAQQFGRNKVQYNTFEFEVLSTEHFDIHYYPEAEEGARQAARMAERWYTRLSPILGHEFDKRKPIIFYANDADFRQTNVVGGMIGEGVQGVTESFRQRVVMPLAGSYAATDHILGHELIHQFQYDISMTGGTFREFVQMPLWIIEGMAEYFSVGRTDAHTAMWLRDAAMRDAFPTLRQLTRDSRYFPYRYGQAFWAWISGTYGDEAAVQLFRTFMYMPMEEALIQVTGLSSDSLAVQWKEDVEAAYLPLIVGMESPPYEGEDLARAPEGRLDSLGVLPMIGRRVLARDIDAGNQNFSPQLSPNGRFVAFLSERDLFGIDLYLADAQTGQIIRRLQSVGTDPHLDAIRFMDSAGTWSPDGQHFAFVTYVQGSNELAILSIDEGEITERIQIGEVASIKDPAWSPDGRYIALSGMRDGSSDLYIYDRQTTAVRQLTSDWQADIQPAWHPDGQSIVFSTERDAGSSLEDLTYSEPVLAEYNLENNSITLLNPFPGSKQINPQFTPDGENVLFISDVNGISNVYRYHVPTGDVYRITNVATGISGITATSPAISVASQSGELFYTVFEAQGYNVYGLTSEQLEGVPVVRRAVAQDVLTEEDQPLATIEPTSAERLRSLPPRTAGPWSRVERYLATARVGLPTTTEFPSRDYRPRLLLDYITQPSIGVGYDPLMGFGAGGGVAMRFSDMLGNNILGATLVAQGTLKDIGGQVAFLNQKHRVNWGVQAGHIPFLQGYFFESETTMGRLLQRTYFTSVAGVVAYPLSQSRRLEATLGAQRIAYGFELQEVDRFWNWTQETITPEEAAELFRLRSDFFDPLYFAELRLAFVGDNSFFGFTAPVRGHRFRFSADGTVGSLTFATLIGDYRHYHFVRPFFTLAARGIYAHRFTGGEAQGRLYPLSIAHGTLVRGYSPRSHNFATTDVFALNDILFGSQMAVANFEVRMPFFGIREFGLINMPYLPTDLALFVDIGATWGDHNYLDGQLSDQRATGLDRVIVSTGIAARVNILGAIILEPYYAIGFNRFDDRLGVFGLNFMPGW